MGIETILGAVASPIIGSLVGGAIGGSGGGGGNQTTTTKNEIDPRMAELLYGKDNQGGLLSRYMELLNKGQSPGMSIFGNAADNYIGRNAGYDMNEARDSAFRLMKNSFDAPYSSAAQGNYSRGMEAASANPSTNINLNPLYADFLYGQAGNNPYLTGAIQKGINQGTQSFQDMQTDLTRNLTENILPSIQSNAIANGQFGGSRQGIAQGKALNDFTTNMTRAAQRTGSNAVDSAIAAQAGQYNTDRSNQLGLLGNLSGQQFGANQLNAQLQQQANAANFGNRQAMDLANLGNRQQSNLQNGAWQLANNQLNSQNKLAGMNAVTGMLNNWGNLANSQNNQDLARYGAVNSMIAPYANLGMTQTANQPYYQNQGAGMLGGAMLGNQLWGNLFGGGGSSGGVPQVPTLTAGQVGGVTFPGISGLNFF